MIKKGLIYLFEGEGKGKTSSALGVTVRGLLNGWRVCWISFIKEEAWAISEKGLREKFDNLEMYFVGKGFYIDEKALVKRYNGKKVAEVVGGVIVDGVKKDEHRRAAEEGLELARQKLISKDFQLIVLDEIANAISEGLLDEGKVLDLLVLRGEVHVVLTGRLGVKSKLREKADLVTECRKIKHPYDRGQMAVKGLDY